MFKILSYIRRSFPLINQVRNAKCCKPCPEYDCPRKEEEEEGYPVERHPINEKRKPHGHLYKKIFFFVCIPLLIGQYLNCYYFTPEKTHRPIFKPFEHLRIRRTRMNWSEDGVKGLFHHPRYNALPTGYEFEVPPEEEFDPEDRFKNDPHR